MRLGNGAINGAGQGHNEPAVGVDNRGIVCILLWHNGIPLRGIGTHMPRGSPHTRLSVYAAPSRGVGKHALLFMTTTLHSGVSPVDMEDNP